MSKSKTILHFNISGKSGESLKKIKDSEKAVIKRV